MTGEAPDYPLNIFDPAVKADPYPVYAGMRAAGRVVRNPFMLGQYMVSGYDDVLALLNDAETFSNGRLSRLGAGSVLAAPTMLDSDPPDHDRLRAAVARAFTPRSVTALEPKMHDLARSLLTPLAEGAVIDVVSTLSKRLPVLMIAEMLGVDTADLDDFVEWSDDLMGVLDVLALPEVRTRATTSSKHLHDYFAEEAKRRRNRGSSDDLVGRLVAANSDGRLSEAEMLAACVLLLLGGNETTTNLITNTTLALARQPDQRSRLAAEADLLPSAIEESLRYDAPVQGNARIATRPVELAGVDIAEGSLVVGLLGSANRDEERFPDADRFDVGRQPNPHLSFGRGIHFCLGSNLARLEARAAIGALLRIAPDFDVADEPLEYGASFFFHSPTRLLVTAT